LGKLALDDPRQSLADYLDNIYKSEFDRYRTAALNEATYQAWAQQFNATLDGLGRTLWKWLPEKFRAAHD
jgi:hypothetical protein